MNIWPLADPRLLTREDLIAEHTAVHKYLELVGLHQRVYSTPLVNPETYIFIIFRHELIRIAANKRSGHKHSEATTRNQRAHPSPLPPQRLARLDDYYLRGLRIYELWVYVRRRTDIELIDLLFHALMKKVGPVPQVKHSTPWVARGLTPNQYLKGGQGADQATRDQLSGHRS